MKKFTALWKKNLAALRSDERGAESSEVILVLVLLVIGLFAAWRYLKEALFDKTEQTGDCIRNANTADCGD